MLTREEILEFRRKLRAEFEAHARANLQEGEIYISPRERLIKPINQNGENSLLGLVGLCKDEPGSAEDDIAWVEEG